MNKMTEGQIVARFKEEARSRTSISFDGFHRAGVLVPLVATPEGVHVLLTRRTETVETHKGQISFPGGMADPADRDIIHTALREAQEEVGLEDRSVEVLGLLDDHVTPTGFVITPVVGLIRQLPELRPNRDEVAEIFHVGLEFFARPENFTVQQREFKERVYDVYFYNQGGRLIWGATAAIIRSLLRLLGETWR